MDFSDTMHILVALGVSKGFLEQLRQCGFDREKWIYRSGVMYMKDAHILQDKNRPSKA